MSMPPKLVACALVLAVGCGGDDDDGNGGPLVTQTQYGVDPNAAHGFTELIFDTRPFYHLVVGVEACTPKLVTSERLLLVLLPPETVAGETLAISSETSLSIALAAGDVHASVGLPDAVTRFSTGGSVEVRSIEANRITARVRAQFEAGPFEIDIDAPRCVP